MSPIFKKVFVGFNSEGGVTAWNEDGLIIHNREHASQLIKTNVLVSPKHRIASKAFFVKYGVTPAVARKIINAWTMKNVIKPNDKILRIGGYKPGKCTPLLRVKRALENHELMQQCVEDGIDNVSPICTITGKSPQELKKELGKGLWKSLAANSYTRNLLIVNKLENFRGGNLFKSEIERLNKIPSTILKSRFVVDTDEIEYLRGSGLTLKQMTNWKFTETFHSMMQKLNIYRDCCRMCRQRGIQFNPKWSERRIKEMHEHLVEVERNEYRMRYLERNSENDKLMQVDFKTLFNLPVIESEGIKATPLVSTDEVRKEGQEMHHCVGSYAFECARGHYVVYSLTDGTKRSTLGINVVKRDGEIRFAFSQHYHACNQEITSSAFENTAVKVIEELNRLNKKGSNNES